MIGENHTCPSLGSNVSLLVLIQKISIFGIPSVALYFIFFFLFEIHRKIIFFHDRNIYTLDNLKTLFDIVRFASHTLLQPYTDTSIFQYGMPFLSA